MLSVAWLMLGTLLYSLQLNTGTFPRPLSEDEERHYLALAKEDNLEARNILIERNLRLVAHIMNKACVIFPIVFIVIHIGGTQIIICKKLRFLIPLKDTDNFFLSVLNILNLFYYCKYRYSY